MRQDEKVTELLHIAGRAEELSEESQALCGKRGTVICWEHCRKFGVMIGEGVYF